MEPMTTIIKGATVIDGIGTIGFVADVGITGDRIVQVGKISDINGANIIDAKGLALCPGFIEGHTHYDPQLCWDKLATPTLKHGVTTIVTGACSFTLAPVNPRTSHISTGLFKKAEDLSQSYFDAAVPYSWNTFPEYLEYVRPGLGINVAPYVGHTPLRHFVMGDAAQQRVATDEELDRMCDVLREAIRAGGVGLSMSYFDCDENSVPIASRWADLREKVALAKVVAEEGRGVVQCDVEMIDMAEQFRNLDELAEISLASGVQCQALGIFDSPQDPTHYRHQLAKLEEIEAKGARVVMQTTTKGFDQFMQLSKAFFLLYMLPVWKDIMNADVPERIEKFKDLSLRPTLQEHIQAIMPTIKGTEVLKGFSPASQRYEGRKIGDIAKEEGKPWVDVLLDIALEDDLETKFAMRDSAHTDTEIVGELLNHRLVMPSGGSDGGAHVAQFCTSGDTTWLLENWVRNKKKMTLENAIRRFTSEPANDFKIKGRGVIQPGKFADLVLFDPDTVTKGADFTRDDLPDGGSRFLAEPTGIHKVWVNGQIVVDAGEYTSARAGRLV